MNLENKKCVMVINSSLSLGIISNCCAIMGMTIGKETPEIIGENVFDNSGNEHLGIIQFPVPILKADLKDIQSIRKQLYQIEFNDIITVDFSSPAQSCKTYDEFVLKMKECHKDNLSYYGIALCGPKKKVIHKSCKQKNKIIAI